MSNEALPFYDPNGQVLLRRMRYRQPGGGFVIRTLEQREFDAADRLILVRDILGGETRMEYDEAGNLIEMIDPTGATLRWAKRRLHCLWPLTYIAYVL